MWLVNRLEISRPLAYHVQFVGAGGSTVNPSTTPVLIQIYCFFFTVIGDIVIVSLIMVHLVLYLVCVIIGYIYFTL